MASSYDIVGPYFISSSSVENTFVTCCVFETISLFQCHGLKTSLLVCDAAGANMSTSKASQSHSGAYGAQRECNQHKFEVTPWLINHLIHQIRSFGLYASHIRLVYRLYVACFTRHLPLVEGYDQCFVFF